MEQLYPLFISFIMVFIAELGDKTQLLVLSFSGTVKTKKIIYYIIIFVSLFISPRLFMNTTIEYHVVKEYFIYLYSIPIFVLLIIAIILIRKKKRAN